LPLTESKQLAPAGISAGFSEQGGEPAKPPDPAAPLLPPVELLPPDPFESDEPPPHAAAHETTATTASARNDMDEV